MTGEAWWITVTPTPLGWEALATSSTGRELGVNTDGGTRGVWRPGERWARAAALRLIHRAERKQARASRFDARSRIYPVER